MKDNNNNKVEIVKMDRSLAGDVPDRELYLGEDPMIAYQVMGKLSEEEIKRRIDNQDYTSDPSLGFFRTPLTRLGPGDSDSHWSTTDGTPLTEAEQSVLDEPWSSELLSDEPTITPPKPIIISGGAPNQPNTATGSIEINKEQEKPLTVTELRKNIEIKLETDSNIKKEEPIEDLAQLILEARTTMESNRDTAIVKIAEYGAETVVKKPASQRKKGFRNGLLYAGILTLGAALGYIGNDILSERTTQSNYTPAPIVQKGSLQRQKLPSPDLVQKLRDSIPPQRVAEIVIQSAETEVITPPQEPVKSSDKQLITEKYNRLVGLTGKKPEEFVTVQDVINGLYRTYNKAGEVFTRAQTEYGLDLSKIVRESGRETIFTEAFIDTGLIGKTPYFPTKSRKEQLVASTAPLSTKTDQVAPPTLEQVLGEETSLVKEEPQGLYARTVGRAVNYGLSTLDQAKETWGKLWSSKKKKQEEPQAKVAKKEQPAVKTEVTEQSKDYSPKELARLLKRSNPGMFKLSVYELTRRIEQNRKQQEETANRNKQHSTTEVTSTVDPCTAARNRYEEMKERYNSNLGNQSDRLMSAMTNLVFHSARQNWSEAYAICNGEQRGWEPTLTREMLDQGISPYTSARCREIQQECSDLADKVTKEKTRTGKATLVIQLKGCIYQQEQTCGTEYKENKVNPPTSQYQPTSGFTPEFKAQIDQEWEETLASAETELSREAQYKANLTKIRNYTGNVAVQTNQPSSVSTLATAALDRLEQVNGPTTEQPAVSLLEQMYNRGQSQPRNALGDYIQYARQVNALEQLEARLGSTEELRSGRAVSLAA